MLILAGLAEQFHRRSFRDRQACERHFAAKRDGKGNQTSERMTHQVDPASRPPDNGFDRVRLMGDGGIARGAAFGSSAISEQARRHAAEAAGQSGDH